MVLIILSEKDPVFATRAMFARFTYLVVPLSVLFIKYYTEYGKYFSHAGATSYCGVATEKNALGCLAMVAGIFLIWDYLLNVSRGARQTRMGDIFSRGVLSVMVVWLIIMAQSSTAMVCLFLGAGIILLLQLPSARRQVRNLGTYVLALGLLTLLLYSVQDSAEWFVGMLGRDMTLTGRTLIWSQVLTVPIDPFFGVGFESFWMPSRVESIWKHWNFRANQAHNGYLETYLNGGLAGLLLLLAMIFSCGRSLKKEMLQDNVFAMLCISFLFINLVYNFTEAMFSKMSPLWFILLLCCLSINSARSSRIVPPSGEVAQEI
jgi:O-antigen ligase